MARWLLHDIRSPVQSLTLLSDLLEDPDANVQGTLREVSDHLGRSLELLSRVMHPPPAREPGPVSVPDAVEFIASLHRSSRTHVRLETDVAPGLPAALGVDRHLEHALLNLVLNALKAAEGRTEPFVRITARTADDRIEIVVADNGPGIAPELADRLFSPDLVRWSGTGVTGAGLLAAREVLHRSGGTLTAAHGPAPGAVFVITLPVWRRSPPGA